MNTPDYEKLLADADAEFCYGVARILLVAIVLLASLGLFEFPRI